jgi:excisionase family DNA binding protein
MLEVNENAFYTLPELSAKMNTAITGLRSWIKQGKLKATKVGRQYMVKGKDLLSFIEAGTRTQSK